MKWIYLFGLIMSIMNSVFIVQSLHSTLGWLTAGGFALSAFGTEIQKEQLEKRLKDKIEEE